MHVEVAPSAFLVIYSFNPVIKNCYQLIVEEQEPEFTPLP